MVYQPIRPLDPPPIGPDHISNMAHLKFFGPSYGRRL